MNARSLVVPTVAAVYGLLGGVVLPAATWGEQTAAAGLPRQADPCVPGGCLVWTGETAIDGVTPGWLVGAAS